MSCSVWDLPGFDHNTLTAAANYLHHADEQQPLTSDGSTDHNSDYSSESDGERNTDDEREQPLQDHDLQSDDADEATPLLTEKFLDRLAQIFAPEKKLDETVPSTLSLHGTEPYRLTSDDVTATALVRRKPKTGERGKMRIFISKNKGLNKPDKEFGNALVAWFNRHEQPFFAQQKVNESASDPTWDMFVKFSMIKIRHYVSKILQTESKWQKYKAQALGSPEIIQGIRNVFVQVDNLIAGCKRFQQARVLSTEADQVLEQAHGIRCDSNFRHLPRFSKVGKGIKDDINFLGRLVDAWETMSDYTAKHHRYHFSFHYLEVPDLERYKSINQKTIQEKINSYPQNMDKRNTTLKILEDTNKLNFAVHCEMQLLLHFDVSEEAKYCVPYFGCSKLSCWMCNKILESYSRYRTKRSHGRIVGLWAFDSTNPSPGIILALKSLQDNLTNKLVEEVVRAGVSAKGKSLKSSMVSKPKNLTTTQAKAYTNINRTLDKAENLAKKLELGKTKMSTPDVSTSIGEKLLYQLTDRTTEGSDVSLWLVEQQKIKEQEKQPGHVVMLRIPQKKGDPEWLRIKIIEQPTGTKNTLPWSWPGSTSFGRRPPMPNFSERTPDVLLDDWGYFEELLELPGMVFCRISVTFTTNNHLAENESIFELAADAGLVGGRHEGNYIPHGDVFIMGEPTDGKFVNMPWINKRLLEAHLQDWLKRKVFGKALEDHYKYSFSQEAEYDDYESGPPLDFGDYSDYSEIVSPEDTS